MPGLWSSASYEAHLLSLPFALAPAAMLIVIAYTTAMRGARVLRGWVLLHALSLLPYAVVMTLSPSITDPGVAEQAFQIGASTIPMAAASGTALQLAVIRRYRRFRGWIWFGIANAAVWVVISATSSAAIDGVRRLGGFWYPNAGPWAWLALLHTLVLSIGGFVALARVALTSQPSMERRQQRLVFAANVVTYAGLVDVGLAYDIGVFPLGWLLSGIGSLLLVRALVVEDLLRVRAVDTRAPLLVLHFTASLGLGWFVLEQMGSRFPWWVQAIALVLCFVSVRASVATIALVNRGARGDDGPLERLLGQLVGRARTLLAPQAIAQLAIDIVELGVGVRPTVLLASEADWGWTDHTGARLADDRAPDPFLVTWLAERRGALFVDDLEAVPADLRELAAALFERSAARAVLPVAAADELLALILVPAKEGRRLRGRSLAFLDRAAERLAEALLHARMAQRAATRAALAREVELAATVQAELLPGTGPHVHGPLTVIGSWRPATRCAGDFWTVAPLGAERVLVAIGDVTGHGVASAMVTAAAVGAVDVCVRRDGEALDLRTLSAALDAAVRRVGGGVLAMTCFAAIVDVRARELTFVSCGHPSPYLCRPLAEPAAGRAVELAALVGRGNLLGAGTPAPPKVVQRALQPGDLLVWYTDGVIEAADPAGAPFGDRRLQQLLRRLDRARLTPHAVHDLVQASVTAHRAGQPLGDDETVVVAQLGER